MPTNTTAHSVGDTVRFSFVIQSTAGTTGTTAGYTNSDSKLIINPPAGSAIVAVSTSTSSTALTVTSTGQYQYDVVPSSSQHGRWTYHFKSTGAVTVSTGGAFAVRPKYASS